MPSSRSFPLALIAPWLAMAALALLAWLAYHPGLDGGYLFDDFVNLNAIGATGRVDNWPAFWRYITSGSADPTGRPLSLLSFLVDAQAWPADPRLFLRTNVLLHLANATLLFALLRQLGRRLDGSSRRNDAAALLGAALWALHPLFVSTTLYIVQREAMLAATCALLGLLAWGRGRAMLASAPLPGAAWLVAGIGFGTLLALSSKANGIVLPLLALVLEATVYRRIDGGRCAKYLRWALLVLPSLALGGYVLSQLSRWSAPLDSRPWTIGERVLTEPRILLEYLRLLVVPRVLSTGLYNDGYVWSTGWVHPATTLPAMLVVLSLAVVAWALRKSRPALAAALLFFLGGHLVESTTLPLELYFEHRNYLPAMLLGWPLARGIVRWRAPMAARYAVAAGLVGLLAAITWQRASLWADQPRMAGLWTAMNPGSSRAIATQAMFDIHGDRPDLAMAVLSGPWQRRPYDLQLALNYIDATCLAGGPTPADTRAVERALRHNDEGAQLVFRWLGNMLDAVVAHGCPGVTIDNVKRWTQAELENPRVAAMPGRRQDLHAILGRIALAQGDGNEALREFRQSLDALPGPDAAAQQSSWLASAGYPGEGLALLAYYDSLGAHSPPASGWNMARLHAWVLQRQGYWPHEFAVLRAKMRDDLRAQAARR